MINQTIEHKNKNFRFDENGRLIVPELVKKDLQKPELTPEQEDYLLEEARERDFENKENGEGGFQLGRFS